MRLAISNIAWDVAEDEAVAALLKRQTIDAIDIAPGKYFPQPLEVTTGRVAEVRHWWAERGLSITGLQGLLFGTIGLNVFGPASAQALLLEHLRAVCGIASGLGAARLVFGSPKNRDRQGLSDAEAFDCGVAFFRRVGDIAAAEGVVVCLEPNPARYGANFMTTSAETAAVVTAVDHRAIAMQLDSGALTLNAEEPGVTIARHAWLIGHAHASEPDLVTVGDGATRHDLVAQALAQWRPDVTVCIEMVAAVGEPHLQAIERAVAVASAAYRSR